ncbi:MAG TPA: protease modulator HflC [Acidobacteriota bacterium]|nr:protease modulator HflC [Acidobacteriota bacterium]
MNTKLIIIIGALVVALLVIIVLSGSLYIVDESQQAVITQFGKIIGEPVTEPGLHFKAPFVQEARMFEKRVLDWEGEKTVIKTVEQKFIYVEVYARWRITDPKLYLQTVAGSFEVASSRLDAIIDPIVRDFIAKYELSELVRSDTERVIYERVIRGTSEAGEAVDVDVIPITATTLTESELEAQRQQALDEEAQARDETGDIFGDIDKQESQLFELRARRIERGRFHITQEIFRKAKEQITRFGIDLIDVRILRINYQPETRNQVYNRMISERKRVTARYISQGQQKAAELLGTKDRMLREIESKAEEQELRILGEGEATAIATYAAAYNRDPDFYKFWKSLETLKATVDKDTWIILSTDSEFYQILKSLSAMR